MSSCTGRLKLLFAADISLYDLAIMNAHGDTDRLLVRTSVLLVPTFDRFDDLQGTRSRVCGISQARQGRAKKSHQPVAQEFVYRSVMRENFFAQDA
jgi:hypothetical protein